LNEEINLPNCLTSLEWCDQVTVLDSFSNDASEKIVKSAGARFYQRKFDNYASQRNFGLNEIEHRNRWILMVDADETVPPDLAKEILSTIKDNDEEICLYRMRRKDFFMGKWIRHSSGYPTWFGRLVKVGRVWVKRSINEEYHTDGKVENLKGHLNHYSFNKGMYAWFEKHNRYSTMEAELITESDSVAINWSGLFANDATFRRKNIKSLLYKMPCRPALIFFSLYILRRGFLDGRAGLTFCLLRSFYEFMIDNKKREIERRRVGLPL
jgi:glycosyltransferase involved in cell wall biosynthesis